MNVMSDNRYYVTYGNLPVTQENCGRICGLRPSSALARDQFDCASSRIATAE
jgi:hypothetical protein